MYMIGKMVSYLYDFGLLHYYLCKYNNCKNKLSPITTCFNLYKSSSGYYKTSLGVLGNMLLL